MVPIWPRFSALLKTARGAGLGYRAGVKAERGGSRDHTSHQLARRGGRARGAGGARAAINHGGTFTACGSRRGGEHRPPPRPAPHAYASTGAPMQIAALAPPRAVRGGREEVPDAHFNSPAPSVTPPGRSSNESQRGFRLLLRTSPDLPASPRHARWRRWPANSSAGCK